MSCRYKEDQSGHCKQCPEFEECTAPRIEISYPYGLGYNAGFAKASERVRELEDQIDNAAEQS